MRYASTRSLSPSKAGLCTELQTVNPATDRFHKSTSKLHFAALTSRENRSCLSNYFPSKGLYPLLHQWWVISCISQNSLWHSHACCPCCSQSVMWPVCARILQWLYGTLLSIICWTSRLINSGENLSRNLFLKAEMILSASLTARASAWIRVTYILSSVRVRRICLPSSLWDHYATTSYRIHLRMCGTH